MIVLEKDGTMYCLFEDVRVGDQFTFEGQLYVKYSWTHACMIIDTYVGPPLKFYKKELVARA